MKKTVTILILSVLIYSCVKKEDNNDNKEVVNETTSTNVINKKDPCYETGKLIFKSNCCSCHSPNRKIVANPFQGIRKAYGLDWCVKFINNSEKLIESGDVRANHTFLKHNKLVMIKFPALDKETINCILEYVDSFPVLDSSFYEHYKLTETEMKEQIKEWEKQ